MSAGTESRPASSLPTYHLKRKAIVLVSLALTMTLACFALPWVQPLFLPARPSGAQAWLIRPEYQAHVVAAAIVALAISSAGLMPLRMQWQIEDREAKARRPGVIALFHQWRITILTLLAGIVGFAFYVRSSAMVETGGIVVRKPWSTEHYGFNEVVELKAIPDGGRNDSLKKNGPWYRVELNAGGQFDFSPDNEGLSGTEMESLRVFLEERTKRPWRRIDDGYSGP